MVKNPDIFLQELVSDLKPVQPLRQRTGMAVTLAALGTSAAVYLLDTGARSDLLTGRPDPMFVTSSGLFLVLALASAWAVIDMARPWVGTWREGWGWTALMAAVLPITALGLAAINWLRGQPIKIDSFGIVCLESGITVGLFTAIVLVLWLRRGAPSSPRYAGLLTGVAAGSAGVFAVSLHCGFSDLMHIGIWHGLTVVLTGLLGRLALPRLIRW